MFINHIWKTDEWIFIAISTGAGFNRGFRAAVRLWWGQHTYLHSNHLQTKLNVSISVMFLLSIMLLLYLPFILFLASPAKTHDLVYRFESCRVCPCLSPMRTRSNSLHWNSQKSQQPSAIFKSACFVAEFNMLKVTSIFFKILPRSWRKQNTKYKINYCIRYIVFRRNW